MSFQVQCEYGAMFPGGDFVYRCRHVISHEGEHHIHSDRDERSLLAPERWRKINWRSQEAVEQYKRALAR